MTGRTEVRIVAIVASPEPPTKMGNRWYGRQLFLLEDGTHQSCSYGPCATKKAVVAGTAPRTVGDMTALYLDEKFIGTRTRITIGGAR